MSEALPAGILRAIDAVHTKTTALADPWRERDRACQDARDVLQLRDDQLYCYKILGDVPLIGRRQRITYPVSALAGVIVGAIDVSPYSPHMQHYAELIPRGLHEQSGWAPERVGVSVALSKVALEQQVIIIDYAEVGALADTNSVLAPGFLEHVWTEAYHTDPQRERRSQTT